MKIAIFVETYLPYINGVVTHVKALKDGLEKCGHTVMVITTDVNTKKHYQKGDVLYCPAKEFKSLYGYGLANPVSGKRSDYVKKFNPDIIHIHQEFGVGLHGYRFAKKNKIPVILTFHTMYDEYIYYVAPKPFIPAVRGISHQYMKYLTKHADAITGPSAKVQKYVDDCGIKKTVNVISNPVELDSFTIENFTDEDRVRVRTELGIPEDKTIFTFVGRLGREKSIDVILKNMASTLTPEDNIHLLVIGDGPSRQELIDEAKALGVSDMVTFTGKVMHDVLPPYYSACKAYITASLSDTNSISMLEGMAAGLPVIHVKDELNKGQVTHDFNGYIFDSAEEMAKYMRFVRDMPEEDYNNIRANVLEHIQQFSEVALAKKLLKIYRTAIINKKP